MLLLRRASKTLALMCSFLLSEPTHASNVPIHPDTNPGWRHVASLAELTEVLDEWLDINSSYGRSSRQLTVRLVNRSELPALIGAASRIGTRTRGLYDPESGLIALIRPWEPERAQDVSVLLHELVHHRQVDARHWYCPGAQEPDAYALQQTWLAERGLTLNANRIAIVLEAGCAPRDIHPD